MLLVQDATVAGRHVHASQNAAAPCWTYALVVRQIRAVDAQRVRSPDVDRACAEFGEQKVLQRRQVERRVAGVPGTSAPQPEKLHARLGGRCN